MTVVADTCREVRHRRRTMTMPPDPMSGMAGAAAELHEMFASCIDAGFTRKEALYLVGKYLAAVVVARNQAAAGDEDDG